ncbi:hypothetical protein BGZ91_006063 [Linnemannia elongata]|nr:hypothetical protein BGZ91_006063 [Linnemannia elongata]
MTSTFLSRSFSDQGVRIRIRKDHHVKPKHAVSDDAAEGGATHMHSPPSSCHEAEHSDHDDHQPAKRSRPSPTTTFADSPYVHASSRHVPIAVRPKVETRYASSEPIDRTPPSSPRFSPRSYHAQDPSPSRPRYHPYGSEEEARHYEAYGPSRHHTHGYYSSSQPSYYDGHPHYRSYPQEHPYAHPHARYHSGNPRESPYSHGHHHRHPSSSAGPTYHYPSHEHSHPYEGSPSYGYAPSYPMGTAHSTASSVYTSRSEAPAHPYQQQQQQHSSQSTHTGRHGFPAALLNDDQEMEYSPASAAASEAPRRDHGEEAYHSRTPSMSSQHSDEGPQTTQQYLDQATALLGKGEYNLALQSYDAAIDRDPSNYLSYFKRAATYLTLGRNNQALADFTTILKLKPDFGQALLQRGKIYTKAGEFAKAKQDLEAYYASHRSTDPHIEQEIPALLASLDEASKALALAEAAVTAGQTEECVHILGSAILTSPLFVPFRLQRAECHLARGEVEEAVNDLNRATHNAATNPQLMHRLSTMSYYSLYMPEQALAQIKQCISFDPENKLCKALFRKLKATEKEIAKLNSDLEHNRWAGVINKSVGGEKSLVRNIEAETTAMETENKAVGKIPKRLLLKIYSAACKAYTENKDTTNALKWCSSTLSLDESNVDGLVGRGMAHMLNDDFEEAIRDFTKAQELAGGQDREIHEKLSKAQRLLKQSQQKDYYKILGVSRSATPREIKKAFRKQALLWHPDTYRGELSPDQVEKKMAGLNEAYEVLSDPELRARFDNGDDPNDPQAQQNPFGQGFGGNPFFFQQGGHSANRLAAAASSSTFNSRR